MQDVPGHAALEVAYRHVDAGSAVVPRCSHGHSLKWQEMVVSDSKKLSFNSFKSLPACVAYLNCKHHA